MWRKLLFFLPVIIAALAVYWAVGQRQPPVTVDPTEQARNVRTITVEPVALVPRVSGFGTVEPANRWDAIVQVAGEIVYVHPDLKRGKILPEGTEIIRISASDYELAIAQANANISQVDAQLAELDLNEQNVRATLEIERQSLEIRERELERRQQLAESGTISATALDQDTRDTLAARKRVQELENTLALIPAQRRALEEQKKLNELERRQAELNLERTRISLPFDARIAEVNAEVTQFAQAGTRLVTADGIATSEVEAQIPIAQFGALARAAMPGNEPGTAVSVSDIQRIIDSVDFDVRILLNADAITVEWPAEFSRISDTIDLKTRSVGVIVTATDTWKSAVPGERPPLSKGLFVEVELRAEALPDRIVVPRTAVHGGRVYLADQADRLKIVPVEAGLSQRGFVVIQEGLQPGDRVVVSDLRPAIDGMLLRPVRDEALEEELAQEASGETAEAREAQL